MRETIVTAFKMLSTPMKAVAIAIPIIIIIAVIVGVFFVARAWLTSDFSEREAERERERQELMAEREALIKERDAAKLTAAEEKAKSDALIEIGEQRKTNMAQVVEDVKEIEARYDERKKQIEAQGDTVSDDELDRMLRQELCAAGYKVACTK